MGLVVGNRSGTGNVTEFRWQADGRRHDVELDVMASESLLNVQPVGLSGNDVVASGENWANVKSIVGVDQDGIDIERGINSIIGIAFQMDSLLPAHRVSSGAGSLGLPNAYWLLHDGDVDNNIDDVDGISDAPDVDAGGDGDSEVEPLASTSSGGGGGCALNTAARKDPDPIFPLLMLALLGYWFRRRWR